MKGIRCCICDFRTPSEYMIMDHIKTEHPQEYALHKAGWYKRIGGYKNRK